MNESLKSKCFCFLSLDLPAPLSLSSTPSCRFPSVFHFFSHSSCHSPPLSFCLPFYTLISHYQRCHVREWAFWGSRGVCLQRGQLNLRLLFETYTSKSLPPHTLPIAHSPLTKLYIYRAVDGRWALFLRCVYLTYGREKKQKKQGDLLKHNVAPWW